MKEKLIGLAGGGAAEVVEVASSFLAAANENWGFVSPAALAPPPKIPPVEGEAVVPKENFGAGATAALKIGHNAWLW